MTTTADVVLECYRALGIEPTRAQYVCTAFLGRRMPDELSAEEEATLPRHLQDWRRFDLVTQMRAAYPEMTEDEVRRELELGGGL